ncbi:type II toxin-antitoxin system RelE/ParE family toxin [Alcanivorax jadensis]|uniref:type II toxin-antitoxin system RelE/ParE family toxin n=1 Tax=Alcanivorax jadensis TaxID=64988 RepID=UPI0026EE049E|nr:type II toxin-antitoxin system RelE/ParE family toxin [Alcanivorax jadensis]
MELFWTLKATDNRDEIHEYIETDNPSAALALDEFFSARALLICSITRTATGSVVCPAPGS